MTQAASPPLEIPPPPPAENPDYLSRQLITYIGNKRALLPVLGKATERVKARLGRQKLRIADLFSGSGVASRFFKAHASALWSNDLEDYAAVIGRCYLRNASTVDWPALRAAVAEIERRAATETFAPGFFEELYAPRDEARITRADRVFYTRANARRLDTYRRLIAEAPAALHDLLLGPLLSGASVHANTAGVFKGFYKDKATRIGQFGGSGRDALSRITGAITLDLPVLSNFECECHVLQGDANRNARRLEGLDLAYLDPPYNQHPYGSNYFMLNLLVRYERPQAISRVSGIPDDWQRSDYNVKKRALAALRDLLDGTDARFLLVSFNDEGFIAPELMRETLAAYGTVEVFTTSYNAFRGSRSFEKRSLHVKEHLFLVERN
jgi:adenine-specific DNA-methyltransferase